MLRSVSTTRTHLVRAGAIPRVPAGMPRAACASAFSPAVPLASSSRHPLPATPTAARWLHGGLPDRKGKARWDHPLPPRLLIAVAATPRGSTRSGTRAFHASARRDALPLLPVGALLKSTSLLTAATAFSRILISFFPIGTLATFRLARGVTWMSMDKRIPKASADAEEFVKMWCDDERGVRLTMQDAADLVDAPETEGHGVVAPDGRIAYLTPMPRDLKHLTKLAQPSAQDERKKWVRHRQRVLRQTCYFLPDLPPASVRYYHELSPTEQSEVDALRHYRISLRMFKDRLRTARWAVALLMGLPMLLIVGVWLTGLERVPFTGRWRLILLTADEEDTISHSLEGANWFKSVINLLTTPEKPAPPIVPLSDWRWSWVQGTLRQLESGVIWAVERDDAGDNNRPPDATGLWPPPSKYPLRPRSRAAARLHAALPGGEKDSGEEHLELGPPYNIMIMEAPDKNAFSYGFGGKGSGGIVIFTGLLDDILAHDGETPSDPPPPPPERGFFGSLLGSPQPRPRATTPAPTDAQTLHLATVIAHEMAHLLLSHHLEALSHQQVLWPSVVGLSVDVLRAFIWPFTIFLGPTVNDALANLGRVSTEELTKRYSHIGFDTMHEHEADLAALRLLAHSGYDPRVAVDHFAGSLARLEEIQDSESDKPWWSLFKLWTRDVHPSAEERVKAMSHELDEWVETAKKEETKANKS